MSSLDKCFGKENLLDFIFLLEFGTYFKIYFIKEADVEMRIH